ncbi:hypothetical protein N2152v2_008891 [Parachlorella kessleri]
MDNAFRLAVRLARRATQQHKRREQQLSVKIRVNVSEEYLAYNRRRWGGDGWTNDLRRSGAPDGATFKDWQWWPNTLHAHRLVALAKKHGKGHEANAMLFQKSYEEGQNISRLDTLVDVGEQLGLPGVTAYLSGQEGLDEVRQDDAFGKRELNISGVPFFIISSGSSKRYALSGAQPVKAFASTFEKVLAGGAA